uniref:Uncharacterized protein n=1 Tax=Davidia involucrata TaxID=16924 RepID=A0A5B6YFQ8_DAVIN
MTRFCTCTGRLVELNRKRKLVAKAPCNTCGRPLVDGIRPLSASMLSTVGLELMNFINPDLTWKTVTKGYRSAPRRSRRPASRRLNVGVQLDDRRPKRVDESSVSESEKLGVAVLGQRFADKVEHIPIKKRRLLLRSPSPPPWTPSPHHEESLSLQPQTPSSPLLEEPKQLLVSECASGQLCPPDSISSWQMGAFDGSIAVQFGQGVDGGDMNGKLEDFSGITLLAAAACNNIIGDDADNVKESQIVEEFLTPEGIDSTISAKPLKKTIASLEEESVHEDNMGGSFVRDISVAVSRTNTNEDGEAVKRSVSSKDDRLHWDLNTVMDAWEKPCDDLNDVHANHMLLDSKVMVLETCKSNTEEHILEARSGTESLSFEVKSVSTSTEHEVEPLEYASDDTKASTLVVGMDTSSNNPHYSAIDHISSTGVPEKSNTTPVHVVTPNGEDSCRSSAMQLGKTVSFEGGQLGKHVVFSLDMAVSEKAMCVIDSIPSKDDEESGEMSGSPDNRNSLGKVISAVTCQTPDLECSFSKSDKLGPSHPSPESENLSALGTSVVAGQPVVTVDVRGQDDKAFTADAVLINSPLQVGAEELVHKSYGHSAADVGTQDKFISHESCKTYGNCHSSHFGEIDLEDPSENCNNLDVSHDGLGEENMAELQSGYESPFEDGELRESVLYCWEENEIDGETECVDYESDDREADDFDAADCSMSEKVEVEQCGGGDALKEPSHSVSLKTKFSGWDLLPESCECSTDRTGEVNDVSTRKIHTTDCMDGHDMRGSSTGEVGSRASKGKLLSRIEGPSRSDVLYRKGAIVIQQSRYNNLDGSYFRAEREFGSEKSLGRDRSPLQMHERSQEDGPWVNSSAGYWDSRNRYPTGYHGPGHCRPRRVIADTTAKVDGLTCCNQRQPINYSSKGVYRTPIRRRSPTDRDDVYGVHRVRVPVRDISRLSRGRTGIYSQGVSRGPREEYRGPGSEDPASSSVHVPHYLGRGERSFSPSPNRGVHVSRPHRRSRSRSRTRSPLPWHLQRERNVGIRRHSRSPDLRSEFRMKRVRLPFQKSSDSSYAGDKESFMSLPRGRISPQCDSRWIDDPNCVADDFRDRRSPVRMFRRSQRFDSLGSPGRLKSDDYFRRTIRPGRFTEMAGSTGRGHRYDDSDYDRRKQGDRYEMIHRVRRFDTNGVVRRFRYDTEDCFEAHNEDDRVRGTDRRDVPRNAREERGLFRYNSDRMYMTGPKSSGIRECDDASPRRG